MENIGNPNICTITVNPKDYFEKFKNKSLNKKQKGVRKDTKGMCFDAYTDRITSLGKKKKKKKKKKKNKKKKKKNRPKKNDSKKISGLKIQKWRWQLSIRFNLLAWMINVNVILME